MIVQSTAISADLQASAGAEIESVTFQFPDPSQAVDDMIVLFDSAQADGPVVLEVVSRITSGSDQLSVGEIMGGGGLLYWREGDEITDVWARMMAVDFAIMKGTQVYIQRFFVPEGDSLRFVDMEAADHTLAVSFTAWEAYPVNGGTVSSLSATGAPGPIRLLSPGQPGMTVLADDCGYNRPPGGCVGGGDPHPERPTGSVTVRALESTGPRLRCTPRPVERGQNVTCSVTPQTAYRVVARTATKGSEFSVLEYPGTSHAANSAYQWQGPAAADETLVIVYVEQTVNGVLDTVPYRDRIRVRDRVWPKLQLRAPSPINRQSIRGRMLPYPNNGVFGNARPELAYDTIRALPVTRVPDGPNKGLSFLSGPFPASSHSIYLHPSLYNNPLQGFPTPVASLPQAWHADQNGGGSNRCTSAVFTILTPFAERHEGVTQQPNSHWGKTVHFYQNSNAEQQLERLYKNMDEMEFRYFVYGKWEDLHTAGSHRQQQVAFDSTEYSALMTAMSCNLDHNPRDP